MKTLQVFQAKPNPAGKDKNKYGMATATQLAAEWVDIKNIGNAPVNLQGVTLFHKAYTGEGAWKWAVVVSFTGILPVGHVMRVHSGSGAVSDLRAEDLAGAQAHVFTQKNEYVWNNAEGDEPTLFDTATGQNIDSATYSPNPTEGRILVRVSALLI